MQSSRPSPPAPPCEVTLGKVQPADLPAIFAFECDPAWRAMAMVKPRSEEAFKDVWAKIFHDWAAGDTTVVQRAILADGELCGSIGCLQPGGRCTVGYGLGQAWWGRGIASRALALLLAEVSQRPLYATTAATNAASIRVLTKFGFVIKERRTAPETERCLPREELSFILA